MNCALLDWCLQQHISWPLPYESRLVAIAHQNSLETADKNNQASNESATGVRAHTAASRSIGDPTTCRTSENKITNAVRGWCNHAAYTRYAQEVQVGTLTSTTTMYTREYANQVRMKKFTDNHKEELGNCPLLADTTGQWPRDIRVACGWGVKSTPRQHCMHAPRGTLKLRLFIQTSLLYLVIFHIALQGSTQHTRTTTTQLNNNIIINNN